MLCTRNKRLPFKRRNQRGFTLIELLMALGIITNILATVIPDMNAMFMDAKLSKAEQELITLKTAVTSYWKNNNFVYPTDVSASLVAASPQVISAKLNDPWTTDNTTNTYGYLIGDDAEFGTYFAVYTWGPRFDSVPVWNGVTKKFYYDGSGKVVGNAPVIKQIP